MTSEKPLTARQIRERMRDANEEGLDSRVVPDLEDGPLPPELDLTINPTEATRLAQERFIHAFMVSITDKEALTATGVSASTVSRWKRENVGGFMDRYRVASEERIRNVEALAFDVVKYFGSIEERYEKILRYPTLLLRLLAAHDPRYRPETAGQTDEANRTMEILTKMPDNPEQVATPEKDIEAQLDDIFKPKQGE